MGSLKYLCEHYLASNLTIETVAQILLLADMHNAAKLKLACIEFITDNSRKVMATEGWKVLAKNADLFAQLYDQLSKRFQSLKISFYK